ncbi:molybdenum cofactor biosynthesis protein B [Pseudoalteromonas sp. PAB 2.2]|uniref:molybdenum cofactor biosynthesis protein B n=1 Tax=Pseudoalteromonas sp. PAB 2.2 TaxID=1841508 RepID=UPI00094F690C|nr:molybdenum cofactor biosynthesis protein B [Pseudoalteromonas sp. PAB 2.2]
MARVKSNRFVPLNIAILTVSNSRGPEQDTAGDLLQQKVIDSGHHVLNRQLHKANIYKVRAEVATWIASDDIDVVLISGGTGLTPDDITPSAIDVLFDVSVSGFGELFRHLSCSQIGTSSLQSRALAGLSNRTLLVAMPGSPNACATAWDEILCQQLDSRCGPCNFVAELKSHRVEQCHSREMN